MKNFSSAYVHIPFCLRKCNYCAFYSKVGGADEQENYIRAMEKEISRRANGETIGTIYFGGGTPTTLGLTRLEKILDSLQKNFSLTSDAEITVEANPCTLDEDFLCDLKNLGFNRLSLGVQSFDDDLLKILGRLHDSRTALKIIELAEKFFDNVSIDLMYALPTQTLEKLSRDLEILESLNVQHVSIYGLEVEEGTKFFELAECGKLNLPDEDLTSDMYDLITEKISSIGFNRYEISNFAKKNFESRHNLGYWTGRKYFGFGAAAHSYDKILRTSNIPDVDEYIKKISVGEKIFEIEEVMTRRAEMEEFCFLGLRLTEGISAKTFQKIFGENIFDVYREVIKKNLSPGLLKISNDKIFLTPRGMKLANIVMSDFLFDEL